VEEFESDYKQHIRQHAIQVRHLQEENQKIKTKYKQLKITVQDLQKSSVGGNESFLKIVNLEPDFGRNSVSSERVNKDHQIIAYHSSHMKTVPNNELAKLAKEMTSIQDYVKD